MKGFEKLLSPIEIAPNFVLKNRMIKAPQSSWRWNEDCTADGSDAIAMYGEHGGRGSCGYRCRGHTVGTCGRHLPGAYDDRFIPGMIELNEAVHKHGCLTIGQLHHIGPSAAPTPDGLPPISSSTLSEDEMPVPKRGAKPLAA